MLNKMPHQSDTQSNTSCKIYLNTYPEHRRKFGSVLVAKLPIHTESREITDRHPAKVKSLIFLENVANTQFSRIHVFNIDPPLQGCSQDSGNYHWIPDPSFTSPGIDNR